jgi:hypothetical protein
MGATVTRVAGAMARADTRRQSETTSAFARIDCKKLEQQGGIRGSGHVVVLANPTRPALVLL